MGVLSDTDSADSLMVSIDSGRNGVSVGSWGND